MWDVTDLWLRVENLYTSNVKEVVEDELNNVDRGVIRTNKEPYRQGEFSYKIKWWLKTDTGK